MAPGFALQTISSVCPSLCSCPTGLHTFRVFLLVLLVGWDQKTFFPVSEAMSQLLCPGGRGGAVLGCFPNSLSSWEGSAAILSMDYELIFLSVCVAWGASMPVLALVWGAITSAHLPLGLSATELHTFQELSSALLVRRGWKALSMVVGTVTQHLAWVWAKWALGPTKVLI